MAFLRRAVGIRYRYTEYFCGGRMLRPPRALCDVPVRSTQAGQTWYRDPVEMPAVLTGAWQTQDGRKILITVNITEKDLDFTLRLKRAEYGVRTDDARFDVCGDECTLKCTAEPLEIRVIEL